MNKVFLGGTCAGTTWRDELIEMLDIDYFNPVVSDWTPECQEREEIEKELECDIHLYLITKEMEGVFSIAEAIESAHMEDKLCIFAVINEGFTPGQLKSLKAVASMVSKHGGISLTGTDVTSMARFLNSIPENRKIWNY